MAQCAFPQKSFRQLYIKNRICPILPFYCLIVELPFCLVDPLFFNRQVFRDRGIRHIPILIHTEKKILFWIMTLCLFGWLGGARTLLVRPTISLDCQNIWVNEQWFRYSRTSACFLLAAHTSFSGCVVFSASWASYLSIADHTGGSCSF